MTFFNLALTVFSPYLVIIPIIIMSVQMIQKNNLILLTSWNIGLLLLFIWSFIVGVINSDIISTAASILLLLYFLTSVYLQNRYYKKEQVECLLGKITIFLIAPGLIGVIERFTNIDLKPSWWKHLFGIYPFVLYNDRDRVCSTFGNPNIAAMWFAIAILICFYLYQRSHGFKKLLYAACTALYIFVLMLTESRGAAIGLFLGLMVYAYLIGHKKKAGFITLSLLMGSLTMLKFPRLFPRGDSLFVSINDRIAIWKNCINMFRYKPITGWGWLGIFFADDSVYHYIRQFHAHNLWITVATTIGIVGLVIFVWMQYSLFEQLRILEYVNCPLTPLLAAVQAVVIGQGLLDFTIMSPQSGILFVGCSAIISSLTAQYIDVPAVPSSCLVSKGKVRQILERYVNHIDRAKKL